ncbi:MAG: putative toxin-antitoxin system toxin component, PIN family [Bacteroidales bacterium]|nr:putative toxin-antitoxin system toxin component, PIN family [Bacteroidales bacterium]
MRHVVVDTNCLLRMIPIRGRYRQVWEAFLADKFVICVSNEIISEYMEILSQKVSVSFASNIVNAILKSNSVKLFYPSYHFNLIIQDPDDNKFVDCAIIANADFLVSEDSHFKVLEKVSFPVVKVITLDQFQNDLMQL